MGYDTARCWLRKLQPHSAKENDTSLPKVVEWLVPLLVTDGIIPGLAGLFQKLYPSGRLIPYYQPSNSITL